MQRDWLVHRIADPVIRDALKDYASGRLLDIGCGERPYEADARRYVTEQVGLDHPGTQHTGCGVDVWAEADALPFEDASFDTVLCIAVLEHLPEPARAISEAYRVLKKEGCAIYLVPLFWHLHEEPHDFYRFTKHGLRYLFEKSGFELVELRALSGFVVTFAQELVYYLWKLRRGGRRNPLWWMIPPLAAALQGIALGLNRFDPSEEFTWMYLVVARKTVMP